MPTELPRDIYFRAAIIAFDGARPYFRFMPRDERFLMSRLPPSPLLPPLTITPRCRHSLMRRQAVCREPCRRRRLPQRPVTPAAAADFAAVSADNAACCRR